MEDDILLVPASGHNQPGESTKRCPQTITPRAITIPQCEVEIKHDKTWIQRLLLVAEITH